MKRVRILTPKYKGQLGLLTSAIHGSSWHNVIPDGSDTRLALEPSEYEEVPLTLEDMKKLPDNILRELGFKRIR